ncbi:MAG: hypothetical protein ABH821_06370 [archaeon]
MKTDYYSELTDETLKELKNFAYWMNNNFGHYPLVIGGWAIWVYCQKLGSRDLDVVLTGSETRNITLKSFFLAHGWKKTTAKQEFVKIIQTRFGEEHISIDVLTKNDVFNINNLKIRMPVKWAVENSRKHKLNGGFIYIPEPELLLCYKIAAQLGRTQHLATATGARVAYLESKIWKDFYDIVSLIKTVKLNKQKLEKFVKKSGLKNYLTSFFLELSDKKEILEEFKINISELKTVFNL